MKKSIKGELVFKAAILLFLLCTNSICQEKPWQYFAKLYTEALGKAPDQAGWQSNFGQLQNDLASMRTIGQAFYTCPEFYSEGYDNASKLLALYRGALNREPNNPGYNNYLQSLDSNQYTWPQVVSFIFNSGEFNSLAQCIIDRVNQGKPYYYWGTTPVIDLPITPSNGLNPLTGDSLQHILDCAPAGSTVYLAQKAVVRLYKTLRIPSNVTLATIGDSATPAQSPTHYQYAKMARLVRSGDSFDQIGQRWCNQPSCDGWCNDLWYTQPLVMMEYGGGGNALKSVWVDGQMSRLQALYPNLLRPLNTRQTKVNIKIQTNNSSQVSNCRVSDAVGNTNIRVDQRVSDQGCPEPVLIFSNLVTCYANEHYFDYNDPNLSRRADGIDVGRGNVSVTSNMIVDASDVAIGIFPACADSTPGPQDAQISYNQIFNAGNSALAGIVIDPLYQNEWPAVGDSVLFTGLKVTFNTLWTSKSAHMDFAMGIGTRAIFFPLGFIVNDGVHSVFRNNSSGSDSVTCNVGVLINGMRADSVYNNSISTRLQSFISLPEYPLIKNSDSLHASGFISPSPIPFSDAELSVRDHVLAYISGPTQIYACPPRIRSKTYIWRAIPIGDAQQNVAAYEWYKVVGGNRTTLVKGVDSYSETYYKGSSPQDFVLELNVGHPNVPDWRMKKYIKGSYYYKNNSDNRKDGLPTSFNLSQNYPNPFNPETTIKYDLPVNCMVKLKIYDVLGREVAELVNGFVSAGYHEVNFTSNGLTSGVYFYRIEAGNYINTKKFILLK